MDAPSKVSMKGIGVSSKWSYQRPEMTEQVQKPKFWGQFGVGGMAQPFNNRVRPSPALRRTPNDFGEERVCFSGKRTTLLEQLTS